MPGMSFHRTRCGVIAGDGEHVRFFLEENRERGVEFLDCFFLRVEVSIFAVHVAVLIVEEEIIELVVLLQVSLKLLRDALRPFQLFHPDQLREALVHRVYGDRGSAKLVALLEGGNGRLMGDAAHQEPIGRLGLSE